MSKKDYVKIAAVLAKWRGYQTSASVTAAITLDLVQAFAADNPRFDKNRFFRAAQGDTK